MDKTLKIAIILSALDKMSDTVNRATGNAERRLSKLAKGKFMEGAGLMATGVAITASMGVAVKAYATLESAETNLQASMMKANGEIDKNFRDVSNLAISLGNKLPGTTADFDKLFMSMQNNGIKSTNILNGVGKAAAYLAVDLEMPYEAAGEFAARMQQATGIADDEMMKYLDTISRAKSIGLNVDEMRYAFMRSTGTLKSLGLQGLDSSNKMSALFAMFARNGAAGEIGGTAFNSIIQALTDKNKFGKASAAAKQMGVDLQFFKDGKFLGVENMVAQFGKLKGLKNKDSIIQLLTGGGQDAQVVKTMVHEGLQGYQKLSNEMNGKAGLMDKVNLKLGTFTLMWEATTGTIENMLAALGKGLMPVLKPIVDLIGMIAGKIQAFLANNPAMAKFIALAVSLAGVFITLMGAVKILKGIRVAMALLNLTMAANPFILIATVAIVAISLIYANWGKISKWFSNLWNGIKAAFKKAWDWIKNMFLNYTPYGLIFKHWDKISEFFSKIWDKVKQIFISHVKWVLNLGTTFYNAGKNIVKSIWEGIKAFASKPVEAIANIVKKIRNFLPFSPAKEGALRDIHKIRLVETIAENVKPAPLMKAVKKVTNMAFSGFQMNGMNGGQISPANGGNSFKFDVNISLSGSATKEDAELVSREFIKKVQVAMKQISGNQQRISF